MNLSELQAFLEDSNWDDEPEPAHPTDKAVEKTRVQQNSAIPTLEVEEELQSIALTTPVKLVPRVKDDLQTEPELRAADSVSERLVEVEMAQKMGYLLCKCTWPPQIMVLTGTEHVYRCRRCSRVREM